MRRSDVRHQSSDEHHDHHCYVPGLTATQGDSRRACARLHRGNRHSLDAAVDARVIILTGAGRGFCAGQDLNDRAVAPGEPVDLGATVEESWNPLVRRLATMPQPVIACVQGVATAAGCQLVAACDLAIASHSARFATSGVNLGLFCSTPAVAITRSVAPKHAAELLFGGDFITVEQAERWGLINRCVDEETLVQAASDWAQAIASKSGAAIMSGKALLRKQRNLSLVDAYAAAGENMAQDILTEDAIMGIDAFLNKQPSPEWKHR